MGNCPYCDQSYFMCIRTRCRKSTTASACSAVDGGTSGCGAPAEIRSVAAGRQVTELSDFTDQQIVEMLQDVTKEITRRFLPTK